jgi:hypothetical protein
MDASHGRAQLRTGKERAGSAGARLARSAEQAQRESAAFALLYSPGPRAGPTIT